MGKFNSLICMGIIGFSLSAPAYAGNDATPYNWGPERPTWQEYKKFHPYLENGKETQNQQWADEDWYVQDWISQKSSEDSLINGFFKADILRKQEMEGSVPVIVVGPQFYRLGGFDKRRVITTVDSVYKVTEKGHPAIFLKDWDTNRKIGVFTKEGLQLE